MSANPFPESTKTGQPVASEQFNALDAKERGVCRESELVARLRKAAERAKAIIDNDNLDGLTDEFALMALYRLNEAADTIDRLTSKGEAVPVAWQRRLCNDRENVNGVPKGTWGDWHDCTREQAAYAIESGTVDSFPDFLRAEARPLYTHASPREGHVEVPVEPDDEPFVPCKVELKGAGLTQYVFEDRPYFSKPVVPGEFHSVDWLVSFDGKLVGMQFWQRANQGETKP